MTAEDIEALWADRQYWHLGGNFYRCPADPRVFVPKRRREMGWTLNFARPSAVPVLLGILTAFTAPVVLAVTSLHRFAWIVVLFVLLIELPLLLWLCVHFASAERAARRANRDRNP